MSVFAPCHGEGLCIFVPCDFHIYKIVPENLPQPFNNMGRSVFITKNALYIIPVFILHAQTLFDKLLQCARELYDIVHEGDIYLLYFYIGLGIYRNKGQRLAAAYLRKVIIHGTARISHGLPAYLLSVMYVSECHIVKGLKYGIVYLTETAYYSFGITVFGCNA